jgi:hypothetical protein
MLLYCLCACVNERNVFFTVLSMCISLPAFQCCLQMLYKVQVTDHRHTMFSMNVYIQFNPARTPLFISFDTDFASFFYKIHVKIVTISMLLYGINNVYGHVLYRMDTNWNVKCERNALEKGKKHVFVFSCHEPPNIDVHLHLHELVYVLK